MLNLLYMHYYIYATCDIEEECDITSFFDNIFGMACDISILLILFLTLTKRHIKTSISLCFITTLVWSFCNILYSRFFFRYISLSAIGQSSNLFDWFMIKCMIAEFQLEDLYYPIILIIFYYIYHKTIYVNIKMPYTKTLLTILSLLLLNMSFHMTYCLSKPSLRYFSYYKYRLYFIHIDTNRNTGRPNWTNYHRGSIRTIAYDILNTFQGEIKLSPTQEKAINHELSALQKKKYHHTVNPNIKNIIFILVESYTAFTTDMKIDGKEVTPFLNKLRHAQNVYYNGKMKSNITIGQSSDGQFIYMTGLLPLRSIITVSRVKNNKLPALPKMMKIFNKEIETRMIIPTLPSLWEQDAMCQAYGFDRLYSSYDYKDSSEQNLNDEQVFQLAERIDKESNKPFFSFILTMSMHGPYTKQVDTTFFIKSKKYCPELINFLNICHYTDKQIEKYINYLKEQNKYDNSLIIIAPDHQVPENTVNTEQYGIDRKLPLFIINGNINQETAWNGDCNQLDVYTTIINTLGINSDYYGLGNSLLTIDYTNSLFDAKWDISEWILLSNYFNNHSTN